MPITVNGLPQQRNFFRTLVRQQLGFVKNQIRITTLLGPPSHRHNTVSAKLVTTDLNSQKRLKRRRAHRRIPHRIKRFVATLDVFNFAVSTTKPNSSVLTTFLSGFLDQAWNLF